jgi:hypothetical protein
MPRVHLTDTIENYERREDRIGEKAGKDGMIGILMIFFGFCLWGITKQIGWIFLIFLGVGWMVLVYLAYKLNKKKFHKYD